MNHAEQFAKFLSTVDEQKEMNKDFLPLLRRVWRKDGKQLLAMVDDSYLIESQGKIMTCPDSEQMAKVIMTHYGFDVGDPEAVADLIAKLRDAPTEEDVFGMEREH